MSKIAARSSASAAVPEMAQDTPLLPRRSRFERAQKERRGGLVLTERDEALLADLFTHQLMDRGQIQELYFSSVPRANARLRQLYDHGLVTRTFTPLSPYGSQGLYRVGAAAAAIVAARLDMDAGEVKRLCRTGAESPQFVEHTLAIVDFYLALRRATENLPEIGLDLWLPELLCRHEYEVQETGKPLPMGRRSGWRSQVFKPDAFVRLSTRGGYRSGFVEIDRGHTSSAKFSEKLSFHRRYAESGLFAQMYGKESGDFVTLVVTTGERRLGHLREIARKTREGGCFWFTTFAEVRSPGPLAPIWQVPGSVDGQRVALVPKKEG